MGGNDKGFSLVGPPAMRKEGVGEGRGEERDSRWSNGNVHERARRTPVHIAGEGSLDNADKKETNRKAAAYTHESKKGRGTGTKRRRLDRIQSTSAFSSIAVPYNVDVWMS
jgi:hypothetical protein